MKYDSQLAYKTQHIRDCLANQELDSGLVKPTLGMAKPGRYRNKMGLTFKPTEISYLENKFINMAIDVDRYKVRYGNDPNPGNVTEEKNRRPENRLIRKS